VLTFECKRRLKFGTSTLAVGVVGKLELTALVMHLPLWHFIGQVYD
jgi:hypothetical protein